MFASFLLNLNPDLTVIVYRDRDGLFDEEIADIKRKIEFDSRVKCVIARFNDIEMYYCNSNHIISICHAEGVDILEQDASTLIAEAMQGTEDDSKKKFYTHRVDKAKRERKDTGTAMLEAEAAFASDKTTYSYGKKVAGLVKAKLQKKFGKNVDIYQPTEQVSDQQFATIHSAA